MSGGRVPGAETSSSSSQARGGRVRSAMALGLPRLARGVQCQPPAPSLLPLAAGLQGQPLSLGFALKPFTAVMGQL